MDVFDLRKTSLGDRKSNDFVNVDYSSWGMQFFRGKKGKRRKMQKTGVKEK